MIRMSVVSVVVVVMMMMVVMVMMSQGCLPGEGEPGARKPNHPVMAVAWL